MDNTFFQLALVLSLASTIGLLFYKLKLPLIVSYLLVGLLLSVTRIIDIGESPVFGVLPDIGVAFVLFLIGMELNLNEIKALGKPIITSAFGQIFTLTTVGFAVAKLLGFENTEAMFMGLGLAFSSTVVIVKMLLENKDLHSLFGKLSIGILLMEDLVAVSALMLISVSNASASAGNFSSWVITGFLLKAVVLFLTTFILSKFILNRVFKFTAQSTELLYITSITWCFLFTSFATLLGFSIEIGAFLAGVALASSPYHFQIQAKVKPMRDFFLTLFFIYLGSKASFNDFRQTLPIILIFTTLVFFLKPLVYLFFLSRFGFRKHTLFQTCIKFSHISEFSLIVLLVGVKSGLVAPIAISIMATVAVFSIAISSIWITHSKRFYKYASPIISFFEQKGRSHYIEHKSEKELREHVIVIGAHRVGGPIVSYLHQNRIPFIVMDFNPTVIEKLISEKINVVYGDIGDPEITEVLQMESSSLIICTASDFADNELLLKTVKQENSRAKVVLRATNSEQADLLKALGADYVILPEKVSGDYIVTMLHRTWPKVHFTHDVNFLEKPISSIV